MFKIKRKVSFFDGKLVNEFLSYFSIFSGVLSTGLIFFSIPEKYKIISFLVLLIIFSASYIYLWYKANTLKKLKLSIDNSTVVIKEGDLFKQEDLKVIPFNEYFDTQVDNCIISRSSLNGKFIENEIENREELDKFIDNYDFSKKFILEVNSTRKIGKSKKYKLGAVCLYKDEYVLTAFSHFDEDNRAFLTMPNYLSFLMDFWDQVNIVYAQRSVSVPLLGSGITRFKGHNSITDEELLKIMIWTFRISEMKFKYPAELSIIIDSDKISKINFYDIKGTKKGI